MEKICQIVRYSDTFWSSEKRITKSLLQGQGMIAQMAALSTLD